MAWLGCNRLENAVKLQLFWTCALTFLSCNRLENAVKPQLSIWLLQCIICCNRLENAVKPQPNQFDTFISLSCKRLENAVKPQHRVLGNHCIGSCNRLENAVKPQQNAGKTSLYSIFTSFMMLFVDFFSHFVIFKMRRVRNAMAFSHVGIAFPAPRRVNSLSVIYFCYWFLSGFVCFIRCELSWLAAGFFSIECRLSVFCLDTRSSLSISRFYGVCEWFPE